MRVQRDKPDDTTDKLVHHFGSARERSRRTITLIAVIEGRIRCFGVEDMRHNAILVILALVSGFTHLGEPAQAGIRMPDAVLYGNVFIDGDPVTAAADVMVFARMPDQAQVIATYQMGQSSVPGDLYVLRVKVESTADGSVPIPGAIALAADFDLFARHNVCAAGARQGLACSSDADCLDSECGREQFQRRVTVTGVGMIQERHVYIGAEPIYGDVNHDETLNIFDVFCVLDALAGVFDECSFEDVDIEPCGGNGTVNVLDVIAVLNAIAGIDPCGGE